MNLAAWALKYRVITIVLTLVAFGGGLVAYQNLSRLEDPEFTIKEAVVMTRYPGASPAEVEEEVTDRLETSIQQLGQLKRIKQSLSERGLSTIKVEIKDKYSKETLPQVWDELRRKVNDAQPHLPPGAGPSLVIDDFGDVYGVFMALNGDEYTYAELYDYAKFLRRELLLVEDVAKVELFGVRNEVIYVEPNRERMAALGIPGDAIGRELQRRAITANAGRVQVGPKYIAIDPTGNSDTVEEIAGTFLSGVGSDSQIYLRDVADVKRGFQEPQTTILRYDGAHAIGIGISTVSGGNVVNMGRALEEKLEFLRSTRPLGMELGIISYQAESVTASIDGFVINLLEAVAIVILVLLLFMGLRSALIIGAILGITIVASFILMQAQDVALQRISLGALIIALGMLVDNAIVVIDGMQSKMKEGKTAETSAIEVVQQQTLPLLGATAVAILAFAAIGTSQDSTGEFCRSLFQVVLFSLGLSWVTGVTVTPLLGVMFLKVPAKSEEAKEPYSHPIYKAYRRLLEGALQRRVLTLGLVILAFLAALQGFGSISKEFFPDSTRAQFMLHLWLPRGAHIETTEEFARQIEQDLLAHEAIPHVTTTVGQGTMRFMLTYTPEEADSGYALFMVDVDDASKIPELAAWAVKGIEQKHPQARVYDELFRLGPGGGPRVEARFYGPDENELRRLSEEARSIIAANPRSKAIRINWRERVKVVEPEIAEQQANLNGIGRPDVASAILQSFEGETVSLFRERDELIPVVVREAEPMRSNVGTLEDSSIWSPAAQRRIPLAQVVGDVATRFEDDRIVRRNRKRMIYVGANHAYGTANDLFGEVRPKIEAMKLPPGYELEWGGEYESSQKAQEGLSKTLPVFLLIMVLIVVALFNSIKQPLVIWLCVPLALIGVSAGLLLMDKPFGFMSILGFLSLVGMLIKNAIVLIDQMDLEIREGKEPYEAVVSSGLSRLNPVAMAALTTALGMLPLFLDMFFVSMAVTIVFGLMVATVLTMVVVPVLYAVVFGIKSPAR